jgi:hypothetical protein
MVQVLTHTQSDYPKANALLPECLHECHAKANAADGCAVDDYVCHCVNFEAYSKVRLFPILPSTSSHSPPQSHPHRVFPPLISSSTSPSSHTTTLHS